MILATKSFVQMCISVLLSLVEVSSVTGGWMRDKIVVVFCRHMVQLKCSWAKVLLWYMHWPDEMQWYVAVILFINCILFCVFSSVTSPFCSLWKKDLNHKCMSQKRKWHVSINWVKDWLFLPQMMNKWLLSYCCVDSNWPLISSKWVKSQYWIMFLSSMGLSLGEDY